MADPRDKQKARDIIAKECEAGVLREFPAQWLDQTSEAISKAAKQGDRAAQKAKKLLSDKRFKKTKD
ncbi:MAG: hypothetical protein L0215_13525 [Gemmataceae bacterium]|nr:hypothetical protein [Gemmataceae bacterium]